MQNSHRFLPRHPLWRIVFIAVLLTLIMFLAGAFVVDYYAKALTTAGSWPITGTPADVGLAYEDVTLVTVDGLKISGWYMPGTQLNAIIIVHGIWANKQAIMPAAIMLAEAGYHVLMIDLRGHGYSEGEQRVLNFFESAFSRQPLHQNSSTGKLDSPKH